MTGTLLVGKYVERDFNSHAHVERDKGYVIDETEFDDFNSHAHVERDVQLWTMCLIFSISTHTLTWSVTC